MTTSLQVKIGYLGADALRVSSITYQQRYNGASFDIELLKDDRVVADWESDFNLIFAITEELTSELLDQLNNHRFDRECPSDGLKVVASTLGLRLVGKDNALIGDDFEFDVCDDS